jgi:hypothetical protein
MVIFCCYVISPTAWFEEDDGSLCCDTAVPLNMFLSGVPVSGSKCYTFAAGIRVSDVSYISILLSIALSNNAVSFFSDNCLQVDFKFISVLIKLSLNSCHLIWMCLLWMLISTLMSSRLCWTHFWQYRTLWKKSPVLPQYTSCSSTAKLLVP